MVAGAEVNLEGDYCLGRCLIFCRTNADGSLDLKDSYLGEWMGLPAEKEKTTTLAN